MQGDPLPPPQSHAAPAAMPRLSQLPDDVLRQIMRQSSQEARAACMTVCRSLYTAATSVGVWPEATFYDLDDAAVSFMERHRCRVVHVVSQCPDDVAWFFEQLRDLDVACIERLYVSFGTVQRMPMDLLCGIGGQRVLRHLAVRVQSLEVTSEVFFCRHHELAQLRSLEITEHTPGGKQLVVWLDGSHSRFERLDSVVLDVGMSDALAGLRRMPRIKRVAYSFEEDDGAGGGGGETFEDLELAGLDLDMLELDLDSEADLATLGDELCKCRVGTLVLHVKDEYLDLTAGFGTRVERLVLRMHLAHVDVKLDFERVRACADLREITVDVGAAWMLQQPLVMEGCVHTMYFTHVASFEEWGEHIGPGPLRLDLAPSTRVHLSPGD